MLERVRLRLAYGAITGQRPIAATCPVISHKAERVAVPPLIPLFGNQTGGATMPALATVARPMMSVAPKTIDRTIQRFLRC
jgi:hypothetical protein